MKILIAEDESTILLTYEVVLRANNHDVYPTKDGEECSRQYQAELEKYYQGQPQSNNAFLPGNIPFDVVVLDYKMPNLDGMGAAKRILKLNPNQRIIFASAYVYQTLQDSVKELSRVVELMQKPFELDTLVAAIEDREVYNSLKVLNADIAALKQVELTHDEIGELYNSLRRLQKGRAIH